MPQRPNPSTIRSASLRDASGTINLVNEAGTVEARQLHETLMVLLHSNWAAVTRTDRWIDAINEKECTHTEQLDCFSFSNT